MSLPPQPYTPAHSGTSSDRTRQYVEQPHATPTKPSQRTPEPSKPRTTNRILGDYTLSKTLGAGSMGKVKLAHHNVTGEKVCALSLPLISLLLSLFSFHYPHLIVYRCIIAFVRRSLLPCVVSTRVLVGHAALISVVDLFTSDSSLLHLILRIFSYPSCPISVPLPCVASLTMRIGAIRLGLARAPGGVF